MHRFEDERLLRGTAHFVEDLDTAECLHAVFVRSPHAHARIVSLDSRAARGCEGVRGVFSGLVNLPQDFRRSRRPQMPAVLDFDEPEHEPLRRDRGHVDEIRKSRPW